MKKIFKFLFVCFVFLISFNVFSGDMVFAKKEPLEKLPETVESDARDGKMEYLSNQQCFVSTYRAFYKSFGLDHVNIYATCIEVNPNEKIDWDYPKISSDAEIKTIYVYGVDFAQKMLNDLKRKKSVLLIEKLAYYKKTHEKYKQGEYYYYK